MKRAQKHYRSRHFSRTPQLVGNFWALRCIEAEEKRKNKAEKGKRREKLEKRKTNLQPPLSGCKLWAFFTIKLGKNCPKCTISAHEMRCAPYFNNSEWNESTFFWGGGGTGLPLAFFQNPSERKRHINFRHINFLCRPSSPGLFQGQTNPVKSGFHCVKQGENPGLSQVFTGFVPGQTR